MYDRTGSETDSIYKEFERVKLVSSMKRDLERFSSEVKMTTRVKALESQINLFLDKSSDDEQQVTSLSASVLNLSSKMEDLKGKALQVEDLVSSALRDLANNPGVQAGNKKPIQTWKWFVGFFTILVVLSLLLLFLGG